MLQKLSDTQHSTDTAQNETESQGLCDPGAQTTSCRYSNPAPKKRRPATDVLADSQHKVALYREAVHHESKAHTIQEKVE